MFHVTAAAQEKLNKLILMLALNEVNVNSFGEELKKLLSSLEKDMLDIAHSVGSSGHTTESSLSNFI